jgi:hypothetical protein
MHRYDPRRVPALSLIGSCRLFRSPLSRDALGRGREALHKPLPRPGNLGVPPLAAKGVLKTLGVFETVQVSTALIQEAIDCSILNQVSFWDSLILAAARSAGCSTVLSEDLNPGQAILGVKVQNPFA